MARYFSFAVLLAVIVALAFLLYKVMAGFIVPVFLAAILVVIFRPTHLWILNRVGGRQSIAAGITTAGILLSVLIPMTLLVLLGAYEGRELMKQFASGSVLEKLEQVRTSFGLDIPARGQLVLVDQELERVQEEFLANEGRLSDDLGYLQILLTDLGEELELPPLPEESETEKPAPATGHNRKWHQVLTMANETTLAVQEIAVDAGQEPEEHKSQVSEAHQKLTDLADGFVKFRNDLLGGSFWSKVKFMANPSPEEMTGYEESLTSYVSDKLIKFGGATTALLIKLALGLGIMTVSLYFFLLDGPRILESLKGLSPIDDAHEEELIAEFHSVSRAVVVATLLSAVAQGILAGIGYYFVGMDSVFLLTLVTTCLALVPFLGAASVWIPVSLYLYFIENQLGLAIGLGIYGVAVVSMVDNFIKPYVLHGASNLHPLLALLSVLGGVTALGPIGILVGPMVVVFLQTLLKILQRELSTMEPPRELAGVGGPGGAPIIAPDSPEPTQEA